MEANLSVASFYHFTEIADLEEKQQELLIQADALGLLGLVILAEEGINGTVAGLKSCIDSYTELLKRTFSVPSKQFKTSVTSKPPFRRLKVKLREEIVTTGEWGMSPQAERHNHLSPSEWQALLADEDVVVIDTRNRYETAIGAFKNAIIPPIKHFSEFSDFVAGSEIPKDKKVLMYCTGGIRCEKAIFEMERQGYEHVFQLDGGILRYLEEFPHQDYEGECFVFDHRVAVDQELAPSNKWTLCPQCGQPVEQYKVESQQPLPEIDFESAHKRLCGCYPD